MKEAFDREKRRYDQSMKSVKKKFQDMPEKLAEQTERLERQLQASADRTHYLESSTGRRAEVDWNYRKANNAFRSNDTPEPMPERGSRFAVVQPGTRQALTVELGDRLSRRFQCKRCVCPLPSLEFLQAWVAHQKLVLVDQIDEVMRRSFGQRDREFVGTC